MAVLKIACPKCGQRVSGDDSFYGTTVDCPVCTSAIRFPDSPREKGPITERLPRPVQPKADPMENPEDPASATGDEPPLPSPREETMAIPLSAVTSSLPLVNTAAGAPGNDADVPSPFLGVISMVLGLVSVVLLCLPGILFGPAAIICGHMARARARHSPVQPAPGQNAALTGLILGYLSLAGFILLMFAGPVIVEWVRSHGPSE